MRLKQKPRPVRKRSPAFVRLSPYYDFYCDICDSYLMGGSNFPEHMFPYSCVCGFIYEWSGRMRMAVKYGEHPRSAVYPRHNIYQAHESFIKGGCSDRQEMIEAGYHQVIIIDALLGESLMDYWKRLPAIGEEIRVFDKPEQDRLVTQVVYDTSEDLWRYAVESVYQRTEQGEPSPDYITYKIPKRR